MKIKNIIVGILTLGILNVVSGCEDFLDKSPDMGLSEDDVYKDYASMRGFMDRAYNFLDNFHSYQPFYQNCFHFFHYKSCSRSPQYIWQERLFSGKKAQSVLHWLGITGWECKGCERHEDCPCGR